MDNQHTTPEFLTDWVVKIKKAGLTTPAILALETHKPLSFIFSQLVLVGQPMLDFLLPASVSKNAVTLFSNRAYLEKFIVELASSGSGIDEV